MQEQSPLTYPYYIQEFPITVHSCHICGIEFLFVSNLNLHYEYAHPKHEYPYYTN